MGIEKINKLICYLIAIQQFAKDIHYSCHGEAFYGKHLFADRIYKGWNGYIDDLKEICILGHGYAPLPSSEYLKGAIELIPSLVVNDDRPNFLNIHSLIESCMNFIETLDNLSKGDENLIGAIAQDLQQNYGLLNLQVEE